MPRHALGESAGLAVPDALFYIIRRDLFLAYLSVVTLPNDEWMWLVMGKWEDRYICLFSSQAAV